MARTYSDLVMLVRRWSNRDIEVLPNNIIADSLRYAADKAYRHLRIAPLEHTVDYTAEQLMRGTTNSNNRFSSVTELAIPNDLIEFIQIREFDDLGRTTRMFNEKADLRTFNDLYAEKYNDFAYWTRFGNCIQLAPGFGNTGQNFGSTGVGISTGIELHYYRRLPALHARFDVSAANANLGLNTIVVAADPMATPPVVTNLPTALTDTPEFIPTGMLWYRPAATGVTELFMDIPTEGIIPAAPDGFSAVSVFGNAVPNWMREENERIVLMGALAEIFFYLQENEEAQKYGALFQQEIQELNNEDVMRNASGGNVQVNFNGRGLI